MKKHALLFLFIILFLFFSSFEKHKFYVSIFQINYASDKKMVQITSRIFVDDLNDGLKKRFNKKTHIGEKNETQEDLNLMNQYLTENFSIKINGQLKTIVFLSKELEGNVLIGYYKINNISKIKTFEVQNTCLLELNSEQQNIIQTKIYGKKQDLLLTNSNVKGMLKED